MKRKYKFFSLLALSSLSILFLFQNCQKAQYYADPEFVVESVVLPVQKTATFEIENQSKPVDIVWTFDNSASMVEEAESVRKNFLNFVNFLQSRLNIRIAIINRTSVKKRTEKLSMRLPTELKDAGHLEIDYFVDSYNSMVVTATALCKESSTDPFCSKVKGIPRLNRIYGALNTWMRPEADKVFIFVADDDSRAGVGNAQYDQYPVLHPISDSKKNLVEGEDYIRAETFLNQLSASLLPNQNANVYGFLSLSSEKGYCGHKPSLAYLEVAKYTGGEAFDICESDWAGHFEKLATQIAEKAKSEFRLTDGSRPVEIQKVSIDGKNISGDSYRIHDNGVLEINPDLFPDVAKYKVDVVFKE